jgi:hypothetical protein
MLFPSATGKLSAVNLGSGSSHAECGPACQSLDTLMSAYSAFLRLGVERDRKLIVSATVQLAAGRLLVLPTPLFEKERDVIASANFVEAVDPFCCDRSTSRTRFTTDNRPVNTPQIYVGDSAD